MTISKYHILQKAKQRPTQISDAVWASHGIPVPLQEYRIFSSRRFRFDFVWPKYRVVVEIEGGSMGRKIICHKCGLPVKRLCRDGKMREVRLGGRHNSSGYLRDIEKYNMLSECEWLLLRYAPGLVDYEQIRRVLHLKGATRPTVLPDTCEVCPIHKKGCHKNNRRGGESCYRVLRSGMRISPFEFDSIVDEERL